MRKKRKKQKFFLKKRNKEGHQKEKNEKQTSQKRQENPGKKQNEMTKKWNDTASCNGGPGADVCVNATTERTTVKKKKMRKRRGKTEKFNEIDF